LWALGDLARRVPATRRRPPPRQPTAQHAIRQGPTRSPRTSWRRSTTGPTPAVHVPRAWARWGAARAGTSAVAEVFGIRFVGLRRVVRLGGTVYPDEAAGLGPAAQGGGSPGPLRPESCRPSLVPARRAGLDRIAPGALRGPVQAVIRARATFGGPRVCRAVRRRRGRARMVKRVAALARGDLLRRDGGARPAPQRSATVRCIEPMDVPGASPPRIRDAVGEHPGAPAKLRSPRPGQRGHASLEPQ